MYARLNRANNNTGITIVKQKRMPPWALGHKWSGDTPGTRLRQAGKNSEEHDHPRPGFYHRSEPHNNRRDRGRERSTSQYHLGGFETLPEETLGQRIRKARLFHGLTKIEFAKAIGVNVRSITVWENGEHLPSKAHLAALEPYLMILNSIAAGL